DLLREPTYEALQAARQCRVPVELPQVRGMTTVVLPLLPERRRDRRPNLGRVIGCGQQRDAMVTRGLGDVGRVRHATGQAHPPVPPPASTPPAAPISPSRRTVSATSPRVSVRTGRIARTPENAARSASGHPTGSPSESTTADSTSAVSSTGSTRSRNLGSSWYT